MKPDGSATAEDEQSQNGSAEKALTEPLPPAGNDDRSSLSSGDVVSDAPGVAGSSEVDPPAAYRFVERHSPLFKVLGFIVAVVGSVAAVVALFPGDSTDQTMDLSAPPDAEAAIPGIPTDLSNVGLTRVFVVRGESFRTTPVSSETADLPRSVCAPPSHISSRADAMRCLVPLDAGDPADTARLGVAYDPCFEVRDSHVVCAEWDDQSVDLRVQEVEDSWAFLGESVRPEESGDAPWGLLMADGAFCRFDSRDFGTEPSDGVSEEVSRPAEEIDSVSYLCGGRSPIAQSYRREGSSLLVGNAFEFRPSEGVATDIRSSDGQWTALYAPQLGEAFQRVPILAVWY